MKILRIFLVLVILAGLSAAGVYVWLQRPYQGFQKEVFVDIERGSRTKSIAATLEQTGVIGHAWQLTAVRALNPRVVLQAGEYHFDQPASVFQVFDKGSRAA